MVRIMDGLNAWDGYRYDLAAECLQESKMTLEAHRSAEALSVVSSWLTDLQRISEDDGKAPREENDLRNIKALVLKKCEVLSSSYLHLSYDLLNDTEVSVCDPSG